MDGQKNKKTKKIPSVFIYILGPNEGKLEEKLVFRIIGESGFI